MAGSLACGLEEAEVAVEAEKKELLTAQLRLLLGCGIDLEFTLHIFCMHHKH